MMTATPATSSPPAPPSRDLVRGLNHVAIVTSDLDRFINFYSDCLGLRLVFHEATEAFRHAILRCGEHSWLHPIETTTENIHGSGLGAMLQRGHLDHLALEAVDTVAFESARTRLVAAGATDGVVHNLGAFQSIWFEDPDGMRAELTLIIDPGLKHFHAPVPTELQK
jgi:catechol 2,3-dioxygenase-like lactoylglutathione lyase family enzyme